MKHSILIHSGTVIDPMSQLHAPKDVLIEDGKIVAIDDPGKIPQSKAQILINAQGGWITPGLIDLHVHLREPGLEYKETIASGTKAAVAGGFTGVACMANTSPVNDSPYVTAFIREKAKATAACRVHIVGAVTKGLKGEELAEIGGMVNEGILAISDDGMPVMNSYLMRKAMDYARAFGIPIISHAEDANLVGQGVMNESALSNELGLRGIPAAAEEIIVAREIALCRLTRTPVHIQHVSADVSVEHIKRAKDQGLPVTAEASPHHLTLTEDCVREYDTHFKMSPPLRTERDVEALRQGLKDGTIDAIATDHAPHNVIDKAVEFSEASNGVIGLQTAVPVTLTLVHEKILSPLTFIRSLTEAPARLLKLETGRLKIGGVADVTVMHPDLDWEFVQSDNLSKSVNSPFFGKKWKGKILATVVGGEVKYRSES